MSMLGENIQDYRCTVEDTDLFTNMFFQLALVTRRQLIIKDNGFCQ